MLVDFELKEKLEVVTPIEEYTRWELATDESWQSFVDYVHEFEADFDQYVLKAITHRPMVGVYMMSMSNVQRVVGGDVSIFYIQDMVERYGKFGEFLKAETWYNEDFPSEYGLCDSIEQFMEKYGEVLEANNHKWTVCFSPTLIEDYDQHRKDGEHINGDVWDIGDELFLFNVCWHKGE